MVLKRICGMARRRLAIALLCLPAAPLAAERVGPADAALPQVEGPIAESDSSWAFNGAAHTRVPQDLAAQGYVEEEYFISGTGRIYDHPAPADLRSIGAGEYVTRILVRRPKDAAKFNGAVVVEPLNPSHMADVDLMWIYSGRHFMREGFAWVGVTFKPVAGEALKRFDPVRYRSISFANPLPAASRCPDLELGPQATGTEVGFSFDILSQLGALIRSDSSSNPLRGLAVSRLYMTGYSQTGGLTRSYAVAISPLATRDGGKRIYDGYLYGGHGPFNVLFNNCEALNQPGDPRLMAGPVGVPLIDFAVEGDVPVTHFQRRPDSDTAPDLFRRYEIAGATHSGSLIGPYTPRADDFARSGGFETTTAGCVPADAALSHFPLDHALNAAWQNLDRWVTDDVPPPRGAPLRLVENADGNSPAGAYPAVEKDRFGNAVGGVRSVAVDVPITRWHGSRGGLSRCMRTGYAEPLSAAVLKELYPSHDDYVRQVTEAAGKLRSEGWLTAADAQSIIDTAWHETVP